MKLIKKFQSIIKKNVLFILIVVMQVSPSVFAAINDQRSAVPVFEKSAPQEESGDEGWHFYNEVDEPLAEREEDIEKPTILSVPVEAPTAVEELERLQKALEESKARAVLYPNRENLTDYMEKNEWMMSKSATFADVWRRVIWSTPELDYSLRSPNSNLALQTFHDEEKINVREAINTLVDEGWGLFFFFKGSCPYCHQFAPILLGFAGDYQMDILPVTLDGGTLPEFPNPKFDREVADELGVSRYPSVYLVQPKIKKIIPVANGFVSRDELEQRIYTLTNTQVGDEF